MRGISPKTALLRTSAQLQKTTSQFHVAGAVHHFLPSVPLQTSPRGALPCDATIARCSSMHAEVVRGERPPFDLRPLPSSRRERAAAREDAEHAGRGEGARHALRPERRRRRGASGKKRDQGRGGGGPLQPPPPRTGGGRETRSPGRREGSRRTRDTPVPAPSQAGKTGLHLVTRNLSVLF